MCFSSRFACVSLDSISRIIASMFWHIGLHYLVLLRYWKQTLRILINWCFTLTRTWHCSSLEDIADPFCFWYTTIIKPYVYSRFCPSRLRLANSYFLDSEVSAGENFWHCLLCIFSNKIYMDLRNSAMSWIFQLFSSWLLRGRTRLRDVIHPFFMCKWHGLDGTKHHNDRPIAYFEFELHVTGIMSFTNGISCDSTSFNWTFSISGGRCARCASRI